MPFTDKEPIQRPRQYARLLSLGGNDKVADPNKDTGGTGPVIIDFPSMPETIELIRSSKFQVETPPNLPDGIHIYTFTEPMKIPFSFKISAHDTFAPQGGVTLLYIAAKLHALALPIGVENAGPQTVAKTVVDNGNQNPQTDNAQAIKPVTPQPLKGQLKLPAWPAVCFLNLIGVTGSGRGIACIGYIENVSAKLKGPFLSADDGSYNIPSSAEYSFSFVHAPSYRNNFRQVSANSLTSAYAGDVLSSLYSTYQLAQKQAGGVQPIVRV